MSYKTKEIEKISDSRTFKRIWLRKKLGCDRCRPHRGCNRTRRYNRHKKNWKQTRKTQYHEKSN